jgi:hypothetical protein
MVESKSQQNDQGEMMAGTGRNDAGHDLQKEVGIAIRTENCRKVIAKSGIGTFLEQYRISWDDVASKITDILSRYLSGGLIQLTIEKVGTSEEFSREASGKGGTYTVTLKKVPSLPVFSFKPYVDVVLRLWSIDLFSARLSFLVEADMALKNPAFTIVDKKITRMSSKSLDGSITLSILDGGKPFKLHSWTQSMHLPEIDLTRLSSPASIMVHAGLPAHG